MSEPSAAAARPVPGIGIVMPVHPPKYPFVVGFVRSMLLCQQAARFAYYPAFGALADLQLLLDRTLDAASRRAVTKPYVVQVPEWCTSNGAIVVYKKITVVREVFREQPLHTHVLAMDAET
eukprot:4824190-Prymnesium_polylepis.1